MLKKTFTTTLAGAALLGSAVFATGCATDTTGDQALAPSATSERDYRAESASSPQLVVAGRSADTPSPAADVSARDDAGSEPEPTYADSSAEPAQAEPELIAADDSRDAEPAEDLQALLATLGARVEDSGYALDVPFATGSAGLDRASFQRLQELAESLQAYPELTLRLEGHADRRGRAELNLALSERRAQAVRDALVAAGLPAERMQLVPLGEQQAAAEPGDADGLAQDRRVTVQLSAPPARDGQLAAHY